MWSETGTITFSTPESFANALRSVRLALDARGLRVLSELDVTWRIQHTLGIRLPPCRILYVWPNRSKVREVYPAAAVVLPLHVVVASRGEQTEICIVTGIAKEGEFIRSPVMGTQNEILQSLETISMRPSLV